MVIFHESLGDILLILAWWALSVQVFLGSRLYWVSSGETVLKPSWIPFKETSMDSFQGIQEWERGSVVGEL